MGRFYGFLPIEGINISRTGGKVVDDRQRRVSQGRSGFLSQLVAIRLNELDEIFQRAPGLASANSGDVGSDVSEETGAVAAALGGAPMMMKEKAVVSAQRDAVSCRFRDITARGLRPWPGKRRWELCGLVGRSPAH